jgi:predicted GNAT family acetyltransferase
MNIQHKSSDSKGEFFVEENGKVMARITFSKLGTTQIIIDHTEVSDEIRGGNVGKRLVEHAINYARENRLKVIPLCPFAKSIIEKDESLQDVLRK